MVILRKAVMIGCGFVGSASVFALMQRGVFNEIAMIDADPAKAEGEAMDISHGIPFVNNMKIYAGTYEDVRDAAMVIITAGANQKPDESRLDLVHKNVDILKKIMPEIARRNFQGILLVVANPVDILTYVAQKMSGLPENRVIGSGTMLDTARFKYSLGEHLSVDSNSVSAFIIGEHGDSEIAVWSAASVAGVPISDFCEMRGYYQHEESQKEIAQKVRDSAYEIIEKKHVTNYGVAMSVCRLCEVIMNDEKTVFPVCTAMHGEHGIDGVVLSMPCVLGKNGIEAKVPIRLSDEEEEKLRESADTLKGIIDELDI